MSIALGSTRTGGVTWPVLALVMIATPATTRGGENSGVPQVTHVEQPTGIDLADYVAAWPGLEPYVGRLRQGVRDEVKADLHRLVQAPGLSDGALNLLAQLERQDGKLDSAEALIAKAIVANPKQHRHHFQQAMVFYARLTTASGLGRWGWQRKTREAYQRAFDLDPRPVSYRYYLAYSFLQTPGMVGGDKGQALRMAQEGIDMGMKEFYVVRADVHRLRGEEAAAFADYDRAIGEQIFKLNSFLAAGPLALEKKDWPRAKRYFEWAVNCRPDTPRTHEGLGDYYAAVGDTRAAATAYKDALRIDSLATSAQKKLAKLAGLK